MFRAQGHLKEDCNAKSQGTILSNKDINNLQSHLFDMYKDIEQICIRHNLNMTLVAGNVLGAIRHGGWIPWDDDLDIALPREDYDKLLNIYASELPEKYIVYSAYNINGPIIRFGKIIDKTTVFSTLIDLYPEHVEGVFIDVFPYDNATSNKVIHQLKKYTAYGLMFIQNSVNQKKNASIEYKNALSSTPEGKIVYKVRQIIGTIFSFISLDKWFRMLDKLIHNKKGNQMVYCGVSTTTGWIPIPKKYLFPAKKFIFPNGEEAFIPQEPEKYLDHVYGNWHKIPDNKDKWHHYVKDFKLSK